MSKRHITVVGAGISGLSVATLLQAEYQVTLVASHFPGEPTTELKGEYASPLAGANWRSDAKSNDLRQQEFDRKTFHYFWNLAETRSSETGVTILDGFDFWEKKPPHWVDPWFKDLCPKYRHLPKKELPGGVEFGITYKTVTINPPKHLAHLLARFRSLGGTTRQLQLSNIQDAIFDETFIVVNCTGLGSRTLGGIEDLQVYPGRGQVVVVQLPFGHVNWTFIRYSAERIASGVYGDNDLLTYVIPRDDGEVILGGTYGRNDYSIVPDPAIADGIIARCLATRPDLLPKGETQLTIKRHDVGLRPVRNGGIRIEAQQIQSEKTGKKVLLCHNYGHAGYGWQSSYGAAQHVIQVLKNALEDYHE